MAETSEPSMEDILSSIKRIIADEGDTAVARSRAGGPRRTRQPGPPAEGDGEGDGVLELTEPVESEDTMQAHAQHDEPVAADLGPADVNHPAPVQPAAELVSPVAASASRDALAALSAMVVKPDAPGNTLEGLVRDMLKPMLKDWLDANLPELVEKLVSKEIARISSR